MKPHFNMIKTSKHVCRTQNIGLAMEWIVWYHQPYLFQLTSCIFSLSAHLIYHQLQQLPQTTGVKVEAVHISHQFFTILFYLLKAQISCTIVLPEKASEKLDIPLKLHYWLPCLPHQNHHLCKLQKETQQPPGGWPDFFKSRESANGREHKLEDRHIWAVPSNVETKHTSISGKLSNGKVTGKKVKDSRLEIGWAQYNPLLWQLYLNSTRSKNWKYLKNANKYLFFKNPT